MSEHETPPARKATEPATQPLADLPPRTTDEHAETPDAEQVKGGMGINRIVVTDGSIKP